VVSGDPLFSKTKMLIAITSLAMNVAIYVGIMVLIIIGSEYIIDGAVWTKQKIYDIMVSVNKQFDNIENAMNNIELKLSNFNPDLSGLLNIDVNILNGIC
jgi:hypothetical protein